MYKQVMAARGKKKKGSVCLCLLVICLVDAYLLLSESLSPRREHKWRSGKAGGTVG